MPDQHTDIPDGKIERDGSPTEVTIARQLTGDLLCVGCGYNLKGLSIRGACSECGTPIRATILGVVDPKAHELQPLSRGRWLASLILMWSFGAMGAAGAVAVMRLAEVLRAVTGGSYRPAWVPLIGLICLGVSGVGAVALIRPHRRVSRLNAGWAAAAVGAYIPLIFIYEHIYLSIDRASVSPFLNPGPLEVQRAALRLGLFACAAIIILGLRPNARGLAVRSVVIREGRVDRQSMLALVASFVVAAVGDALQVAAFTAGVRGGDLMATFGTVLVTMGSVLILIGLTNIMVDTLRLWPVLARRGVGLADVIESNEARSGRLGSD